MDFIVDDILERFYPGVQIAARNFGLTYDCAFRLPPLTGMFAVTVPDNLSRFKDRDIMNREITNDDKILLLEAIIKHQIVEQVAREYNATEL